MVLALYSRVEKTWVLKKAQPNGFYWVLGFLG